MTRAGLSATWLEWGKADAQQAIAPERGGPRPASEPGPTHLVAEVGQNGSRNAHLIAKPSRSPATALGAYPPASVRTRAVHCGQVAA